MKFHQSLVTGLLLLLTIFTIACSARTPWDKDDHEIFELQSGLEQSFGKGTTFYSLLSIPRASSQAEIKRAYRKKSLELHPDKNAGVPDAQQKFERLGLVYKILRDGRKDRYDHFLKSGFPKWRGNGYFYERYRPGLGSVIVGILLFTMAVEVGISRLTSGQERAKIERLKMSARLVAWGPRYQALLAGLLYDHVSSPSPALPKSKIPSVEKKVRVPITGFSQLPTFPSSTTIQNGSVDWDVQESLARLAISNATSPNAGEGAPIVECVVHQQDVLLLDKFTGDYVRLDENDASPSTFTQTWPVRLVQAIINRFTGRHEDVLTEVQDESTNHELPETVNEKKAKLPGKKGKKASKKHN
ncbi:related to ERJ5 - Type I membrane protein preserves the folding capacity of the endoplasmic reticulum [Melanopsichium pennsylvanicum]|uniref:Related to ERJ5 - Type I membrane protein preserves the folding capacity of the endoplasmic reticulum n=2 Tax=Melanopsichium pennsylvanicum TaxID=63383 RepID=A0AAJ4XGK1_9BASI|nr:conserved hypothetical protein [Melanopsichium pennsylvanicum 4]SNX81640.1 related to ERJ5 - Type I membrane protein preserves the folding capacity of the endoplasmic reticulum [Melanopsichium pennsylvanicum]